MYYQDKYRMNSPVDVTGLRLAESVHPIDTLDVMRGIPRNVEDYHPIGRHEIDSQSAGFRGNQEQPGSGVVGIVEHVAPRVSVVATRRTVQSEIVQPYAPGAGVATHFLGFSVLGSLVDFLQEILDAVEREERLRKD